MRGGVLPGHARKAKGAAEPIGVAGPQPTASLARRPFRLIVFAVAGLLLAGAIITRSLIPAIGGAAPQLALAIQPGNTDALLAYAATEFGATDTSAGQSRSYSSMKSTITAALASEPFNAASFGLLGLVADAEGDKARAGELMRTAVALSRRDSVAGIWLMRERFAAADYAAAVRYATVILRDGYGSFAVVAPVLTRIMETPDGAAHVERLMLENPQWRRWYLELMTPFITDARTPLRLMMALKSADATVPPESVRSYLDVLVNLKLYDLAYYTWLQFLPAADLERAGFLFNGNFSHPPSGIPFDWRFVSGTNYTADIAEWPGGGGDRALSLQFGEGRVEDIDVHQTIMLRAGAYVFRGRYLGSAIGPRGVQWEVRCRDTGTLVGNSPNVQGAFSEWRPFEWMFRIPDKGCPAQDLKLMSAARSASEQFIRGAIWFDDLRIQRADTAELKR